MTRISYKKARQMLQKSCAHYVTHNQSQLDSLIATSPRIKPEFAYFQQVFNKMYPSPGFSDWSACAYHDFLECILSVGDGFLGGAVDQQAEFLEKYLDSTKKKEFPFKGFAIWLQEEIDYLFSNHDPKKTENMHDPSLVLYNLNFLFNLLAYSAKIRIPDWEMLKKQDGYQEYDASQLEGQPLSLQVYSAFNKLKELIDLLIRVPCDQYVTLEHRKELSKSFDKYYPTFERYLKGVAVAELGAILNNENLSDQEAVKAVEAQLKTPKTARILNKNLQSQCEQDLKFYSVISILIGVGIFTTLGLVFKRLYDSAGTSINFFKPLSVDLTESMTQIIDDAKTDEENLGACSLQ